MRVRLKTAVRAMVVTGACALAVPAGAIADCTSDLLDNEDEIVLVDSTPAEWDLTSTGNPDDGALLDANGDSDRTDAFDSFPMFSIDDGINGRETYENTAAACEYELEGRQLAFPAHTTTGGLQLSRKSYVPASGPGFARFLNTVTNPTASAQTVTIYTADGEEGDLGSDSNTTLTGTSSGTGAFVTAGGLNRLDSPVRWLTTSDDDGAEGDPPIAHNLDSSGAITDANDDVLYEDSKDDLSFVYRDVTIPAGGTVSYLSFASMRFNDAAARNAALYLDARPDAAFAGLASSEKATIQNWQTTSDGDGDGVLNASDNCPAAANSNQSDLDGDGQGDDCDADIDGDSIANAVETAFGTNPASTDSDADGVRDNLDDCPKSAGAASDGCPVATITNTVTTNTVTMVAQPRRASATRVSAKRMKSGRLKLRSTGKVTGIAPRSRSCTRGLVLVQVRINNLTVSRRQAKLKADCTFSSKVTFRHRATGSRAVRVRATFQGSDRLLPSISKRMVVR